jgi:hypothetical protein
MKALFEAPPTYFSNPCAAPFSTVRDLSWSSCCVGARSVRAMTDKLAEDRRRSQKYPARSLAPQMRVKLSEYLRCNSATSFERPRARGIRSPRSKKPSACLACLMQRVVFRLRSSCELQMNRLCRALLPASTLPRTHVATGTRRSA